VLLEQQHVQPAGNIKVHQQYQRDISIHSTHRLMFQRDTQRKGGQMLGWFVPSEPLHKGVAGALLAGVLC
jgi:hypothetical protein